MAAAPRCAQQHSKGFDLHTTYRSANGSNPAGGIAAEREDTMKIIAAALIALTVAMVAPASAFDPQTFWEQQERNLP